MVLLEFSMSPFGKGESLSPFVARSLDIIDKSGLPYQLTPMGTILEGEWDEVMKVVSDCFAVMQTDCDRISAQIKVDYRAGPGGRIQAKVEAIEGKLGRKLATCLKPLRDGNRDASSPAANLPENPLARKAIEAAVRYLRWVEEGRIADTEAIATVANQYKVRNNAVRDWIDAWSGISLASHADLQPDDVTRQMKISGRQFRSMQGNRIG